ncbi:hypothetical protein J2T02_002978 [Chitinophaga terrae (ex Kim and Jung 2007)]|nr:hypothetical protein [Chitinophaga terrae (ex Kim and Jung 2007)]
MLKKYGKTMSFSATRRNLRYFFNIVEKFHSQLQHFDIFAFNMPFTGKSMLISKRGETGRL